jgi:perosamine synthetase
MISVNEPFVGERELELVTDCLKTGWISSEGRYLAEFEERWAAYCGVEHGVAVANGTVALELALRCLDLQPGDEVIVPSFTIVSCAQAVIYNGAGLVLVDCDPRTFCLDLDQVEAMISPRTRAIMPVHMYGHPVDMDRLRALAEPRGIVLVEDAAQAHGATFQGRRAGGLGDLGCFSFYANKIITTGEGGMVVTRSHAQAARLRSLRNLAFRPERRFHHTELGHNFRLTNLQAAIGVAQIERIGRALDHKRWMAAAYTRALSRHAGLQLPVEEPWATSVFWMYGIVLDDAIPIDAAGFAALLREQGVMTRPFFLGMHEQPALAGRFRGVDRFPVTERLARRGLYLPSGLTLTEAQLGAVCDAVASALARVG